MAFTSRDLTTSLRTRGQSSLWRAVDFGLVGDVVLVAVLLDTTVVAAAAVIEEEEKRRSRNGDSDDSVLERDRDGDVSPSVAPPAPEPLLMLALAPRDTTALFAYAVGMRGSGMLISVYNGPSYSTWNRSSRGAPASGSSTGGAS